MEKVQTSNLYLHTTRGSRATRSASLWTRFLESAHCMMICIDLYRKLKTSHTPVFMHVRMEMRGKYDVQPGKS